MLQTSSTVTTPSLAWGSTTTAGTGPSCSGRRHRVAGMGTGGPSNRFDDATWLPIKFGPVSNGEFHPVPHSPLVREVIRRTHRLADANARRLGISRREFLTGATGAAATLFVLGACSKEEAAERGESPGGTLDVSEDATTDTSAALEDLGGAEFILDVQTHYVNYDLAAPEGEWTTLFPQADCAEEGTADD